MDSTRNGLIIWLQYTSSQYTSMLARIDPFYSISIESGESMKRISMRSINGKVRKFMFPHFFDSCTRKTSAAGRSLAPNTKGRSCRDFTGAAAKISLSSLQK